MGHREGITVEKPRPQELYRHFKGNLYQIVSVAIHSETREEMVVYQALYGDFKVYVRPLDMFMSEVDHEKYPDVKQKMRFQKVSAEEIADENPSKAVSFPEAKPQKQEEEEHVVKPEPVDDIKPQKLDTSSMPKPIFKNVDRSFKKSEIMSKSVEQEAEELNLDPLVIQFMDADLAADKNDILSRLRPIITNDMIDIMAMSLGVVVNEGDVYDRYNDLRTCLTTMEKYESTRLRS